MITAAEAKQAAVNNAQNLAQEMLAEIEIRIKAACKNGITAIDVSEHSFDWVQEEVVAQLEKLGYDIEDFHNGVFAVNWGGDKDEITYGPDNREYFQGVNVPTPLSVDLTNAYGPRASAD